LAGLVEDKDANKYVQLKGINFCMVVAVGCEGVIVDDVTLGAYNTEKILEFIQTKVIHGLDRQRFILIDTALLHKSREIQQAFEDVGHIYFHLPSYSPFLNVA
jgi:hypothetical protein